MVAIGRAVALAALVVALACTPRPERGPDTNEVRAGLYSDPQSVSLLGGRDRTSEIIGRLVTDSLVQYDSSLILQPRLASSWEIDQEGRRVTFHLRSGVLWHDGTPLTADDVLFSVAKARDPASQAPSFLTQFEDLVDIHAPDPMTVEATYSKAYADFLEGWTLPIIPEHLAGRDEDLLTGEFARNPIGCGPFRFVRYEPGVEIVLERNPDYWDGAPEIERLTFRVVPDDRTAYQALLRGDLDLVSVPPDLWRESLDSPEAEGLTRFVYYRLAVWYLAWNQDGSNPWFTDARVRRAMVMALDRPRFIEKVLDGLSKVASTTYHPDSPWADPDLESWPYAPVEAGRLLDGAGWIDTDGDGIRDRDGEPFSFTLTYPASPQEISDRIAAWIQQSLRDIGVRMEIERLEWRAFLERRKAHQFESVMAYFSFTPIPDQYELYHSGAREEGFNFFGFSDPEVDRLLELGRTTFDLEERRRIYFRLQRRLHELEPLSPLFHFASPVLHHPRLEGIELSPLDVWRTTPGPRAWRWGSGAEGG
jgi:peptide/nickel transport system substrate-binding protein